MKSAKSIIPALLLLLSAWSPAYGWDCSVTLDGPTWVKIGRTIDLTASGLPSGGQYYWSAASNLVPDGSAATLTGFKPTYSDYIRVTVRYLAPAGGHCSDTKWVYAHLGDCQLALGGVSVAPVGESAFIAADAEPKEGTCAWLSPTGLLLLDGQGLTAQFTAQTSGLQTFEAEYTTPSGDTCKDTYDTTFFKVGSITSPYACVNSGTTLEKKSFFVTSEPPGYLDISSFNLTISPLTLSTLSQSSAETITASITPESTLDDAKTIILVVNKDHKQKISLDFKIPNYVNETLKLIGVAEDLDLKLEGGFSRFMECCSGISTKNSVNGYTTIGLYANAGPFTIVGIPLPATLKKYVTLDVLAVSVSGSGSASLKGDYNGCKNNTNWGNSTPGELKAGIEVGGEVKVKSPSEALVFEGSLKGSTSVSETIKVEYPNLALNGNWNGLNIDGNIILRLYNMKFVEEPVSWSLLKERPIPQVNIPLPSLN